MKIAVVYHSEGGNSKKVANIITEGAGMIPEIEVKTMSITEIDEEYLNESKAVIFGSPTYSGNLSWQMKKWFDTTRVRLEGKIGSAFATEGYLGGGADLAELVMIGCMLIRGMLCYSAGITKDGPITHYGAVTIESGDDWQRERAKLLGKRVAEKAWELFGDQN